MSWLDLQRRQVYKALCEKIRREEEITDSERAVYLWLDGEYSPLARSRRIEEELQFERQQSAKTQQ
ncbi:MAG TPA: hypothetical protein VH593_14355 [Ktedonobacteraceae bacterium]